MYSFEYCHLLELYVKCAALYRTFIPHSFIRGNNSNGRSLVAFGRWSSVRDRTNRKHCPSHEIWSYKGFYCTVCTIFLCRFTNYLLSKDSCGKVCIYGCDLYLLPQFHYKQEGSYSIGTVGMGDVDCDFVDFTYVSLQHTIFLFFVPVTLTCPVI